MTERADPPTAGGPPIRILLIDDDPGDVLIVRETLEESAPNCELTVADDGDQALRILYQDGQYAGAPRPHLVLLDLNLPKVSGHEVLETMKGHARLAPIPVVVLSTSAAPRDVRRTYQLQASAHITKPGDYADFAKVIRAIVALYLDVATLPTTGP